MHIAELGPKAYQNDTLSCYIPEFPWTPDYSHDSPHYSLDSQGSGPGPDPTIHQISCLTQFPADIGLYVALEEQMKGLISNIEKVISDFLDQSSTKSMTPKSASSHEFHKKEGFLFYAVPGSGKTKLIETLLSDSFGFYFMAGSLDPKNHSRSTPQPTNMYQPRREGYSKDTFYLWKLIQLYNSTFPGEPIPSNQLDHWIKLLLICRMRVLTMFYLDLAKRHSNIQDAGPALWLEFQKKYDPFSALFWVCVLLPPQRFLDSSMDLRWTISIMLKDMNIQQLFFCFDESQADLDAKFQLDLPSYQTSLFHVVAQMTNISAFPSAAHDDSIITNIISGTSLKLKEVKLALGENSMLADAFVVFTEFQLMDSEEKFQGLLLERGVLQDFTNRNIMSTAFRKGRSLHGRYLWSALYVDALKDRIDTDAGISDEDIEQVAQDVKERAKNDLKARLSQIKDPALLRHLCWIAICCEILDLKKITAADEDNQLVDEGFAFVLKDGEGRGSLAENLALEAALEWFLDAKSELVDKQMTELLKLYTADPTALGEAAEWFVAWVSSLVMETLESYVCLHF